MDHSAITDQKLSELTTLAVGGFASVWRVTSEAELVTALNYAAEENISVRFLGSGSNVLAPDEGVRDLVVKIELTGQSTEETDSHVLCTVGAGVVLDEVIAMTVGKGWWGLENLSHIPGTVGATPVQNVGAYGVETKDVVESVRVYDTAEKSFQDFSAADCQFGYRDSIFKQTVGRYVITSVTFKLSTTPTPVLHYRDLTERFSEDTTDQQAIRDAVIEIRSQKFPDWTAVGTAGSFFKNPIIPESHYQELLKQYPKLPSYSVETGMVKVPLGYVLDKILDLRGVSEGNVGTYSGQALVIINRGEATATEIVDFANTITSQVKELTDIDIEWEVTSW